MGKLWMTGDELLKETYQGEKRKFFWAIRRGEIVPGKTYDREWVPIYPDHISPIQGKIAILECLQERLGRDDETILRSLFRTKFIFSVDADSASEDEFKSYAESEEGWAVRKTIPALRLKWKEDSERLLAEIGDPEKILSPAEVWRDVTFTEPDQKRLLEASYLVDDDLTVGGDQEEHPANQGDETDSEMVKRLKLQGLEHKDIARKLKETFPAIYPSRVGRLITEVPGIKVTKDAYRKRGNKLLK